MLKLMKELKQPHIYIALAVGFSIIIMAVVSKLVLAKPIGYLSLAIPPFIGTIFESLYGRYKNSKICTTWYWIVAILIATALVILFHMV